MSHINFFAEDVDFDLPNKSQTQDWIQKVITAEGFQLDEINFIFCSDEYLLQVNRDYLDHDYYTDIITFDNSTEAKLISSDIFISIERVEENANGLHFAFQDELHRVMIHGVLHLLGYADKTEDDKTLMREKEDTCLSLR